MGLEIGMGLEISDELWPAAPIKKMKNYQMSSVRQLRKNEKFVDVLWHTVPINKNAWMSSGIQLRKNEKFLDVLWHTVPKNKKF